jgi:uncharacterized protein GlcG (DUF336 family)
MTLSFNKKSICLNWAEKMIDAAIEHALQINRLVTVAIVDESGHLKAFRRMDSAALISIGVAQDKAYTAVANAWGHTTHEIYDHIKKNPATLIGIPHIPRYTVFGGGFPIKIDEYIIGVIGVSGGSADQDMAVAKAALAIIDLDS